MSTPSLDNHSHPRPPFDRFESSSTRAHAHTHAPLPCSRRPRRRTATAAAASSATSHTQSTPQEAALHTRLHKDAKRRRAPTRTRFCSTMEEVEAARSMAQRGVALVATVHGETLPELVNDSERRNLVGGQTHITLTDTSAEKRPDKRKNPAVRLREPVFVAALELHERERWIYHPSVRDAIDAYYAGEPVQCKLLEPGRTVAAMAIPARDAFIYCLDCGRLNTLCPQHAMSAPRPLVVDAGSPAAGFSFGAPQNTLGFGMGLRPQGGAGGGGGGHRRRPGAWSGIQRSGNCYSCGEYGHFAFECSRR
mmetsp:Transcript_34282/g.90551  ORF Transcript_34282/g.90551 Transcript_34282/m.90551 type:complete len:308 (-) Transcript_34282:822-1745(-)